MVMGYALVAIYNDDNIAPTMFGQAGNVPAFFTGQESDIRWLVNDGINSVLTDLPDTNMADITDPDNIGIYDPFGRNLPLPFDIVDTDCIYFETLSDLAELNYPNTLQSDMIWDATANLYFHNGRVYMPLIGRYLQRDPQGPDVFGNVYNYPSREATPPIVIRQPAYAEGLSTLYHALQDIQRVQQFTANDMIELHHPTQDMLLIEPLHGDLQESTAITRNQLTQQLAFPSWLANNYNLSSAYTDGRGALRLPMDNAPANGRVPDDVLSPYSASDLFTPQDNLLSDIALPLTRLEQYTNQANLLNPQFNTYIPTLWQPQVINLTSTWEIELPRLGVENTPDIIFEWLPAPLQHPELSYHTLQIMAAILELPTQTGESWVIDAFDFALPTAPDVPTNDGITWLESWFSTDTLGVADVLNARYPQLPTTSVPIYEIGNTNSWVEPD